MALEDIITLFFDNIKQLFFPESWLNIDLKFSKSEIFSLLLIDKQQEITMTELSDYIHAPMSTANGVIERLVKQGLILRGRSESDRRIVVLRLTDEGQAFIGRFKNLISGYLKMAQEALTEEEVQTMVGIILKVIRSLQAKHATGQEAPSQTIKKIAID